MPIVSKQQRLERIAHFGVGLRRLCLGEIDDERVLYRCRVNTMACYSGSDEGSSFPASWDTHDIIPLWECDTSLCAERDNSFVQLEYDDPEELTLIAAGEQGMLSYVMFYLLEDYGSAGESGVIKDTSDLLGFEHLDQLLSFQTAFGGKVDCFQRLLQFTRTID